MEGNGYFIDDCMKLPKFDIKLKMPEIASLGFVKSMRKGDTGIGYTLETLMGIRENNAGEPDFLYEERPVELKAQREKASSNITLITKSPHWNPLSAKIIIEKYGYKDAGGRRGLKVSLKTTNFNQQGLKLELDEAINRLNIVHKDDGVLCYFSVEELLQSLREKLSENLLLVFAKTEKKKGDEYFYFNKATMLSNLSKENFKKLLEEGLMVWEFRMHIKPTGSVRDHGAGFRLSRRYIDRLYDKKEVILEVN